MKTDKSENQQEKKKRGRLFLLVGGFIAGVIIIFNVLQIHYITKTTREELRKSTNFEYTQLAKTYANLEKNVVEKYFAALDFYCNSDVVKNGGSDEEIVEWLRAHKENRNSDLFGYVAWIDSELRPWFLTGTTSGQ